MGLPRSVRRDVEEALSRGGAARTVRHVTPVSGGCINHGARIETSAGDVLFLKWNAAAPAAMFAAEADGLTALRGPGALVVPEPLAWGGGHDGPAWLLMELIDRGHGGHHAAERLGRGLAALHDSIETAPFGWPIDNWIGSLPQANGPRASWAAFWRDRRIEPQLRMARDAGALDDDVFDRLLDAIPRALAGVESPCLLHGDLWSGNVFTSASGDPVLIDPAVYRGDGEVDLAMSELFGGFGAGFYAAYREARGVSDAYASHRRALYQLYYLLVHVNLFGGSYVAGSRLAAEQVLAAVG